jgi:hypothetical protein
MATGSYTYRRGKMWGAGKQKAYGKALSESVVPIDIIMLYFPFQDLLSQIIAHIVQTSTDYEKENRVRQPCFRHGISQMNWAALTPGEKSKPLLNMSIWRAKNKHP